MSFSVEHGRHKGASDVKPKVTIMRPKLNERQDGANQKTAARGRIRMTKNESEKARSSE